MDDMNAVPRQAMMTEKRHLPASVWITLGAGSLLILTWAYFYNAYFPSAPAITQSRHRNEAETAALEQELNAIPVDDLDAELESIEQELKK